MSEFTFDGGYSGPQDFLFTNPKATVVEGVVLIPGANVNWNHACAHRLERHDCMTTLPGPLVRDPCDKCCSGRSELTIPVTAEDQILRI